MTDEAMVTVRAPAKVNLRLSVGPRRGDGYHDVVNVFQAVSLHDEVRARPAPRLRVRVSGEQAAYVPDGEQNLAAQAARLLATHTGSPAAVELHIRKAIPVAGGMAGGSADAAAALLACDALWGTGLSRGELADLAARLGSDVPFMLLGGTAVGLDRGERLTPVLARGRYHWVFALARGGLSTAAVYAECDRLRATRDEPTDPPTADPDLLAALSSGDAKEVGARLHNDLQPAALRLRPTLRATLAAGRELGALGALVSGSGPTCAFLVESPERAAELAAQLRGAGVCRAAVPAHGPVPGAEVISS